MRAAHSVMQYADMSFAAPAQPAEVHTEGTTFTATIPEWFRADRQQSEIRETPTEYSDMSEPRADRGLLDASAVHSFLKSLHTLGNQVRLRSLDALRMMFEGNLYFELGYSTYHQYCDRELGLARSTAFEYLRAGVALDELPRLRAMFGQGDLSWQQVRSITRVATSKSEVAWIEFALAEPVVHLYAEVREAQRTGRDAPRDKKQGLPNIYVRVTFDLTLEEKERVRAAFARVVDGLGGEDGGSGAWEVNGRPVLVRWADGILSGAIPAAPTATDRGAEGGQAAQRPTPAQTILYRTCPECRRATLETPDGPVNIDDERITELAPDSHHVEIAPEEELASERLQSGQIDHPNTARLARQVLHRDGLRCANPGCGRQKNLHAHHIVYRSNGGATELANEITVCDICHAMLHAELLEVVGTPDTGLEWRPRPKVPCTEMPDAEALEESLQELVSSVAPLGTAGAVNTRTAAEVHSSPLVESTAVGEQAAGSVKTRSGSVRESTAVGEQAAVPPEVPSDSLGESTAVGVQAAVPPEVQSDSLGESTAVGEQAAGSGKTRSGSLGESTAVNWPA